MSPALVPLMGTDMLGGVRTLAPEVVLLVGALVTLLSGSFLPRRLLHRTRVVALVTLVAASAAALAEVPAGPGTAFDGTFTVDAATTTARVVACLGTAVVLLLGGDELTGLAREGEVCTLLLLATLGTVLLAGASDLLVLVVAFLLASVPLYALVGLARTAASAEASMKTYLMGSLFGILLMAGVTLLYGVGGTTTYAGLATGLTTAPAGVLVAGGVTLLGGLTFKAGAVPGHFWVPDAAQGSSTYAAAFLTSVPKVGAVVAMYRLVLVLPPAAQAPLLVGLLAVASMTLGNLAAFTQDDPRRLLGWSTVSQVGYLLVPAAVAGRSDLALPALEVYLAGYAVTNLAAFAVVAALPGHRTLRDYAGLARRQPWLLAALVVGLLGLVGTPPTAVFVGKLAVATAAWDAGAWWLTLALLLNSVVSLYYYLRWLALAIRPDGAFPTVLAWGRWTSLGAAGVSLVLGLAGAWVVLGAGGG